MFRVFYAERHKYYHYAECRYAECRYAECRGACDVGLSCKKMRAICVLKVFLETKNVFGHVWFDAKIE